MLLLLLLLLLMDVRVGYIVWIAVYRSSSSSRSYRISLVVAIAIGGKGIVEVCLGGRGGIAVVVVVVAGVGVVEALIGTCVDVLKGVLIVLGINVKDGRGWCA
jgi:hypothetical protein